jgi:hypothetical protein
MKTYNVAGIFLDSKGKPFAAVLTRLTAYRSNGVHSFDAGWEREPLLGMEFNDKARAESVAMLVRAWGLCQVVDVVEVPA